MDRIIHPDKIQDENAQISNIIWVFACALTLDNWPKVKVNLGNYFGKIYLIIITDFYLDKTQSN